MRESIGRSPGPADSRLGPSAVLGVGHFISGRALYYTFIYKDAVIADDAPQYFRYRQQNCPCGLRDLKGHSNAVSRPATKSGLDYYFGDGPNYALPFGCNELAAFFSHQTRTLAGFAARSSCRYPSADTAFASPRWEWRPKAEPGSFSS